jgi:Bacterial Ig domain/Ig domain of plant-specific actin-binding protein/Glycosyl hydrolase family 26
MLRHFARNRPAAVVAALMVVLLVMASAAAGSNHVSKLVVKTSAPTNGATVSGSITWQVSVTGGPLSKVSFAVDGTVGWTQTSAPYYYAGTTNGLDTTKLANGSHTLSATAYPTTGGPIKARVTITVQNAGAASAPSATAPPSVSGLAQVGQNLNSSSGSWTGTSPIVYAYQWLRCDSSGSSCANIAGATAQSYSPAAADVGSTLRSQVAATNSVGSTTSESSPTAPVASASNGAGIYWGAYMDGNPTYVDLYGGTWSDAPWDSNTWNTFESHAGKKASLVQWGVGAPWEHDFNYFQTPFNKVVNAGEIPVVSMNTKTTPLASVAGGVYDSSIKTWMQQAAAWGHPFFLIFDVEMNGPWEPYAPGQNGNTAVDYVAAWRHVHDLAVQAGASNISWVWCPNVDPSHLYTPYAQLYPGDAYVNWTGLDGYNKGGGNWRSFATIFNSSYNNLLQLAPSKPIMISQLASVENGGSKASWISDMLSNQLSQNYPQIKAFSWFNWYFDDAGTQMPYEIESSATAQEAFKNGIASSYYLAGGNLGNLPLGQPVPVP